MLRSLRSFSSSILLIVTWHTCFRQAYAMGGNALKKVVASRLTKAQYVRVKTEVFEKLKNAGIAAASPYDYPGKDSFGDIDVLYHCDNKALDMTAFINANFKPVEFVRNAEIRSISYPFIDDEGDSHFCQVDLIYCQDLQFAQLYYSYGDYTAILGHMVKYHGLSYGPEGLYLQPTVDTLFHSPTEEDLAVIPRFRDSYYSQYDNRIYLSNDREQVATYLGFDDRYTQGTFTNRDEMFEAILSSRFFHPKKFLFATRLKKGFFKRPFYVAFLAHLAERYPDCTFPREFVPKVDPRVAQKKAILAGRRQKKKTNEEDNKLSEGEAAATSALGHNGGDFLEAEKEEGIIWEDLQLAAIDHFSQTKALQREYAFALQLIQDCDIQAKRKEKYNGKLFLTLSAASTEFVKVQDKEVGWYKKTFEEWIVQREGSVGVGSSSSFEDWLDQQEDTDMVQREMEVFLRLVQEKGGKERLMMMVKEGGGKAEDIVKKLLL